MLLRRVSLIIQAVKYIEPQIRFAAKAGKSKKEYKLSMLSDKTLEKVSNLAEAPIIDVFTDPSYGKVLLFCLSLITSLLMNRECWIIYAHYIYQYFVIIISSLNVEKH